MEKVGEKHTLEAEETSEKIASNFCNWLRGLPVGETENINLTQPSFIQELFDDQVRLR